MWSRRLWIVDDFLFAVSASFALNLPGDVILPVGWMQSLQDPSFDTCHHSKALRSIWWLGRHREPCCESKTRGHLTGQQHFGRRQSHRQSALRMREFRKLPYYQVSWRARPQAGKLHMRQIIGRISFHTKAILKSNTRLPWSCKLDLRRWLRPCSCKLSMKWLKFLERDIGTFVGIWNLAVKRGKCRWKGVGLLEKVIGRKQVWNW